jgi:hypothetical protein
LGNPFKLCVCDLVFESRSSLQMIVVWSSESNCNCFLLVRCWVVIPWLKPSKFYNLKFEMVGYLSFLHWKIQVWSCVDFGSWGTMIRVCHIWIWINVFGFGCFSEFLESNLKNSVIVPLYAISMPARSLLLFLLTVHCWVARWVSSLYWLWNKLI